MFDQPDLNAFRLFHGDAEGARGLAVDRFGDVGVVHADSAHFLEEWLPAFRESLHGVVGTAYAKVHPRSASRLSDDERLRLAPDQPLWGPARESGVVNELGVRYEIRPASGLSVGLFLDMREVREWLREVSSDRRVLNLFAYTCSLGVCAALGGAQRVINVDLSRHYLEWGKRNYGLNECGIDEKDFIYGDAFDWLRRFARREERFGMVIVDPPSFSSTPFSVTRDYVRLVAAAAPVIAPGGTLLAATNHTPTSDQRFDSWIQMGLKAAGRRGKTMRQWHEPQPDFPVARRPYLKVRAVLLD